jgi:acetyltransferase-like isoleucine patch superfamily enzyme
METNEHIRQVEDPLLQRDHRPYYIKKLYLKFQKFYTNHFLRPQFEFLGKGFVFIKPWHVELFGSPIEIGDYAMVFATPDKKVRLSVWPDLKAGGRIRIGSYSLICPGVRIGSASEIRIGDNCMLASQAYITDSDWHDIYNRVATGKTAPVKIENNVWIGDSAIVCKGVTIGENSIVGAGAIVVDSIPANTIAAGNPAKVVKQLDPGEQMTTREHWFSNPAGLFKELDQFDRDMLQRNTFLHWLRHLVYPLKGE